MITTQVNGIIVELETFNDRYEYEITIIQRSVKSRG